MEGLTPLGGLSGAPISSDALTSSLSRTTVDDAQRAAEEGRTEEAAHAFERLFATMFAKEMRRALPEGFFGDGPGSDVYGGWLDEHLGNALAERDTLGFAASVKEDLLRMEAARQAEQQ